MSFVAFILTHNRPDKVFTYKTLRNQGYTGKIILVIDNEDPSADKYYEKYGKENVYMFDKLAISKTFDTADTSEDRRAIVYARNACFSIAKELGYDYFLELDDDYLKFEHRWIENNKLKTKQISNLDKAFEAFVDFLENTNTKSIAFCQGGDFIGGVTNKRTQEGLLRKAMNSFFCKTDRPFTFVGRINEDVNTFTSLAQQGDLFFSYTGAMLRQKQTQTNSGGMTDIYLDTGTYVKSFYTVIFSPSCTKISSMGDAHHRIHHQINSDLCYPKILNEEVKYGRK